MLELKGIGISGRESDYASKLHPDCSVVLIILRNIFQRKFLMFRRDIVKAVFG